MPDASGKNPEYRHLHASHRRLAAIVESTGNAVIGTDLDGLVTDWNRGAELLYGYSAAEMVGRSIYRIIPPDREHELPKVSEKVRTGESVNTMETVRVGKDGTVRDVAISYAPIRDDAGAVAGISAISHDITLPKRAERALRLSEARQSLLLRLMQSQRNNDNGAQMMQFAAESLGRFLGADRAGFFALADAETLDVKACWARDGLEPLAGGFCADGLGTGCLDEVRHGRSVTVNDVNQDPRTADARLGNVGVRALVGVPVHRDGGWQAGMFVQQAQPRIWTRLEIDLVRQVAHQTCDAVERARARAELREANDKKDEFIAMLGHELRNPLSAIRSATELVKSRDAGDDPLMAKVYGVLERQTNHMAHLIDGLLEVSRLAQGRIELDARRLDLRDTLTTVVGDQFLQLPEATLTLESHLPEEPLWVRGDPVRLFQIFANLLSNAIKYTNPPGTVTVSAWRREDACVALVRDTGIGIRPELLETIFEPFHQEEQELARSEGGLGLGLSLVKGLVELHGGTIVARSAGLGHGSEFEVTLPGY